MKTKTIYEVNLDDANLNGLVKRLIELKLFGEEETKLDEQVKASLEILDKYLAKRILH